MDVAAATRVSISKPNKCPDGFRYNSRLNVCDDIDECLEDSHECIENFELCQNTIGGYLCQEIPGTVTTEQCDPGFR